MSKLLRSELKSIVKECLLEILSEGIGSDPMTEGRNFNKQTNNKKNKTNRRPGLDNVTYRQKKEQPRLVNSNPRPKNTNLTSDPILNELLADTAKTTLHEQVAADSKRGMAAMTAQHGDAAARAVDKATPEEMFGSQAASKWQKLAFFDH